MTTPPNSFGYAWFDALVADRLRAEPASLLSGTYRTESAASAAILAVTGDPAARYPRARRGEVGLAEGWAVADAITRVIDDDASRTDKRPVIMVIDVPSQAYGYIEELAGIHQSLAAAANALASARLAGHPTIGVIVGQAVSGAFLAIGLQAGRLLALDHDGVVVQVMSKTATARITRRTVDELDATAELVPATAYDIRSFARLGALHALLSVEDPSSPSVDDVRVVRAAIDTAIDDLRVTGDRTLRTRLTSDAARDQRAGSTLVRERIDAQWTL
ncbi:biotin-independent malonate decarboxylase subunit gamma [Gordonia sp. NPDC003424]